MQYLYELINLLNKYSENHREDENRIRDLICYIVDNPEYMQIEMYRSVIFEAAQKLRMFGYIKGSNKIAQDEFVYDGLNDIKHSAVQNYYKSKVFNNNLLDRKQKDVIDTFMSLENKRILVSAPTSFGKTFLLREIIFMNRARYRNILLLFPTIALLNENTDSINQLIRDLSMEYKVINNVYSGIVPEDKHIFILTPERALKLLADNSFLHIDFFFMDEIYKIDEDFDRNGDSSGEDINDREKRDGGNRAKAFRVVLYLLAKSVKEYYLAGPYLNLKNVKKGMKIFLERNHITTIQIEFEPTSRIEIEAWKKRSVEYHPILGERITRLYQNSGLSTKEKVQGIANYLKQNNLGQAIFYCSTPSNSMKYTKDIIDGFHENDAKIPYEFIEHLKKKYNVKIGANINSTKYWGLIHAVEHGVGIHHGKFPKYIQNEVLRLFNNGDFNFLFCTSTIIEGVNTNAKNVIIVNNSVGNITMTAFALKNIKGRAGRYYHHTVGRVFYTDAKQRQIEQADDMQLNFQTYDSTPVLKVDIDNALIEDLANQNRNIKLEREERFQKQILPDTVCRILTNELYIGKIINGKQEVEDFLTGKRKAKDETEWMVVDRPDLKIVEPVDFEKAQEILHGRHASFNMNRERQSNKHLFSTLIRCKECGWSFRRTVRTYKNTYVRWVCSGHSGKGADSCPNAVTVDEDELIDVLQEYFNHILNQKKKVVQYIVEEFQRIYKAKDENLEYEKELKSQLNKLTKAREKYMDMYADDLISRQELNDKIGGSRKEIERLENELKMVSYHLTKEEQLENI